MVKESLGNGVAGTLFDINTSIGNMVPSIVTSMAMNTVLPGSGELMGAGMTGLSSGGNAYQEARQLGFSEGEARDYAVLAGGMEAGMQYLLGGVSKLGGKLTAGTINKLASKVNSGIARFALKMGGNMASEGLEEYLQEVLGNAVKNWTLGTDLDLEWLSGDAFYAAMLGAFTAGLMEGPGAAIDVFYDAEAKNKQRKATDALFKQALSYPKDSAVYKYAKKLSNSRYDLSVNEINNLTQAVMTESQNIGKGLYNSTVDALTKAGETGDVDAIAKALVSVMQGAPLNEAEQTLVANSKLANMAVSEANKWTGKITFKKIKEGSKKQDTTFKSRSEALKEKLRAEKAKAESTVSAESEVEGEAVTSDGGIMAEFPDGMLKTAFNKAQESGGDVDAVSLGINPNSEFYKKLESAGIANSDGKISAKAISNEIERRKEILNKNAENAETIATDGLSEITVDMTESERAEILRNKSITIVEVGTEQNGNFDFENLKNNIKSKVEKALRKKFQEMGFFKKYSSTAIGNIEFKFTTKGFNKSLHSQENSYGGTKADFAKIGIHLQELLDKAVLIETHTDKGIGTDNEKRGLQQVYVLHSALIDNGLVIPVQFEVEQYINKENRLYLVVALTKIETGVKGNTASNNQTATSLVPISTISIPELFAKINPADRNFLKYVPDEFLNEVQIEAKRRAQKEDAEKYGQSETGGFTDSADKDIFRKKTPEEVTNEVVTGRYRNPKQRQAEKVAELFGVKIWWDEGVKHAYYNFNTHYIFMNPNLTVSDMYVVIFKHELVHHFELKKGYDGFKNYLFKNSVNFAQYCHAKLDELHGIFEGTDQEAIEAYTKYVYEQYMNSSEVHPSAKKTFNMEKAEMEIVADFVGERLLFGKDVDKSMKALTELAQTDRNFFQRIWDWVKDKLAAFRKRGDLQDKDIQKDFEYLEKRLQRVWDSKDKKTSTGEAEVKYSLKDSARKDVERVLTDTKYREDVYLTEMSPSIIVSQQGVKNLPMLMKASHIRENIFTESEAVKMGLKVDEHTHYHGLGKELFLKIIDGLNDVDYAYRGTKKADNSSRRENYFLLISQYKDMQGNTINVPVYINEKGQYNRVFIDTNKIATVFGREDFSTYIKKEVEKGNLVRIKNKSNQASERTALIAGGYSMKAPIDSIHQNNDAVNSNSMQNSPENAESTKNYIALGDDGEFDVVAPPKPKADKIASVLTKRFGEYSETLENGTKLEVDLKADIESILKYAKDGNMNGAFDLIGKVSARFDVSDKVRKTLESYLGRAAVERMVEYGNYRRESSYKRKIAKRDAEISKLREEIDESDSRKYHREQEEKRINREDRAKNLKNFRSIYNRLATRLNTNSDAKHIPEHLKGVIGSFLDTFKTGSVEVYGKRQRRRLTRKDIGDFITQYRTAETDLQGTPNMAFDESIIDFLTELYDKADKSANGLLVQDLDAYEVLMLSNVANNLWQMVKLAEETFIEGRAVKFKSLSEPCIEDLKSQKAKKNVRIKGVGLFHDLEQGNLTPPYFFKHLGKGFYNLFEAIVEGQGKWALHFQTAKTFVEEITERYNYSKWKNESVTLRTSKGQDIDLTIEQAMQLYATVNRQLKNRKQDARHLNIGGIVLEDSISSSNLRKIRKDLASINKKKSLNESEKNSKIKDALNAFYETYDNAAIQLGIEDLLKVEGLLSNEQKGYADAWVSYLSNNMAALGNETSMLLFGYEKFTEDYYIPYQTAENYLYSQPGLPKGDERIKHLSFTKNTQVKYVSSTAAFILLNACL